MKLLKGIKKSSKCWVRGDYDSHAAECKICPSDGSRDFVKCQKIYQERVKEEEMSKIILKKKEAVEVKAKGKVAKESAKAAVSVKAGKDARAAYVGKTFTHIKKGIKCEVVSIMNDKNGTGVNVLWKTGELAGTKGTSSVSLLK